MGQLCSCHSGKANHRKDFTTSSWSNLLSRRPTLSSWRRRRLKSVEFLGHDNLPFDPVHAGKALQLINRCEKHLSFVTRRSHSAPDQNGIRDPDANGVSDAEQSGGASESERNNAERSGVGELEERIERVLCPESMWRHSVQEVRGRRAMLQWQRSNGGGIKSLNLPEAGPMKAGVEPVQPPLARFLPKKRPNNFQLHREGVTLGDDPWNCTKLIDGTKEWLCGQLDPWVLFQSLQLLHRRVDGGLLALELGRCTSRIDSCRCLLDYATTSSSSSSSIQTECDEGGAPPLPSFRLIREALNTAASHDNPRLARIAEFLEVVDAIADLSRSIGRNESGERTLDADPEDPPLSSTSGERLNELPDANPLPSEPPPPPTKDFRRRNNNNNKSNNNNNNKSKDGYFRCEIIVPTSQTTPCLYATTCASVDRGSIPILPRRDQSFNRRRHSALCHPDNDEPPSSINSWSSPSSPMQPELPSISISIFSIDLNVDSVRKLTRILSDYSHVTHLSIVRTGLGGDNECFGELFRRAFDRCSSSSSSSSSQQQQQQQQQRGIEYFDFRMNDLLEGDCIGQLSNALRCATSLRTINLSSTGLTADACRRLVEAIGAGSAANRALTELDLGYNELSDDGCSSVATLIELPGCWLRKLRLRHNGIGSSGAKRLAEALLSHPRLTLLDVSSNPVGDSGVLALAESLLGNRTLRDVAIDDCGITGEGCRGVARMLMTNSALRSLTLSRNSLRDEGVRTLAEGMRYNRTLEVLGVDMCCLGNAGFVSLLQELRWCHSMRVVRACYNAIGIPPENLSAGYRRWSSASVRMEASAAGGPGGQTGSEPQLLEVYVQLCDVLRQNPKLKIFLWGNKLGEDEDADDVTSASAFKPEVGDPGAKWRRSRSAVDSGYGTLSSEKTSAAAFV